MSSKTRKPAEISIDASTLVRNIVTLLLEYGLHGISHMLLRDVADRLKIRKQRLSEIIALAVPEQSPPFSNIPSSYVNIVLDGYHYRIRGGDKLKGFIMITDTQSLYITAVEESSWKTLTQKASR